MSAPTDPTQTSPASAEPAMRPFSLDWLKGEVTIALPRWALAAGGLVALALAALALD